MILSLLPLLTMSSASALTVVTDSDRITETELAGAVALRCPAAQPSVIATVSDAADAGFELVLFDLESDWLDASSVNGGGYSDSNQTRALSMAICGRVQERPAPRSVVLKTVQRKRSGAKFGGVLPFFSTTLDLDRPTLGVRLQHCFGPWCPEGSAAVRWRPWPALFGVDLQNGPVITLETGFGRAFEKHYAGGITMFYDVATDKGAENLFSGGIWAEAGRNMPVSLRIDLRASRSLITETYEMPGGVQTLTKNDISPAFSVAVVWRGVK